MREPDGPGDIDLCLDVGLGAHGMRGHGTMLWVSPARDMDSMACQVLAQPT